jgi:hypothetical protein
VVSQLKQVKPSRVPVFTRSFSPLPNRARLSETAKLHRPQAAEGRIPLSVPVAPTPWLLTTYHGVPHYTLRERFHSPYKLKPSSCSALSRAHQLCHVSSCLHIPIVRQLLLSFCCSRSHQSKRNASNARYSQDPREYT